MNSYLKLLEEYACRHNVSVQDARKNCSAWKEEDWENNGFILDVEHVKQPGKYYLDKITDELNQ